jgi:hypothetical protein
MERTMTWIGGGNNKGSNACNWNLTRVQQPGGILSMAVRGSRFINNQESRARRNGKIL